MGASNITSVIKLNQNKKWVNTLNSMVILLKKIILWYSSLEDFHMTMLCPIDGFNDTACKGKVYHLIKKLEQLKQLSAKSCR